MIPEVKAARRRSKRLTFNPPPKPTSSPTAVPPVKGQETPQVELYGLRMPATMPRIAIELLCYRTDRSPAKGGLGKEAHFRNAFKLMWPDYEWSEWVDKLIWAWCNFKWVIVIGHQRASKTFTMAHCVLLDYAADPTPTLNPKTQQMEGGTLTSLATVTFEGLKLRMWSDLQRAAETARGMPVKDLFAIRSTTNEARVYPKTASSESGEKYQIHGMAVNQSKDAEGRIRGGHAPRRRIVLDEAQNIADPIFNACINPMSAPDAKCVFLTNPVEKISKFGEWCEPRDGWDSITPEDLSWPMRKFEDGIVLHFDGLQSPNVKAGWAKYSGLLTLEGIKEVVEGFGIDSVQYWALIRGFFCPAGMISRIFPDSVIETGKRPKIFDFQPEICASLDPAFEHDNCVMHLAELGRPIFGVKTYAINCLKSETFKFNTSAGSEPKEYQIAHRVMELARQYGIKPQHFIMDTTGNGRGVAAILQKEWSVDIQQVNYGGAATERVLRADNPKKACDLFKFFISELYFRAAEYTREGLIGGLRNLDTRTIDDIGSRRYHVVQSTKGSLQQAESKDELKKRIGRSPDYGDSYVQLAELLVRLGTHIGKPVPGQVTTSSSKWEQAKEKAKRISARHSESREFAY